MNEMKKSTLADRIRKAWRAFCGKPTDRITLGFDVKPCYKCEQRLNPIQVTVEVIDRQLDGLPLTEAEVDCRVRREIAEKLTHKILEEELYTLRMHDDPIHFEKRYRATVRVYAPERDHLMEGEE